MNLQDFYLSIRTKFFFLINVVLFIYCFIAFLPLPWSIKIGLDESWSYAISHLAQKQFIFGQDSIFTYGALGYLTTGATLDENFLQITLFRWLVYLLLFIVSILRIVSLKNYTQQLFIGLSIVLAISIGTPYIGVGMSTDYQILFIFLIILSFENLIKQNLHLLSLLMGGFSGFCILTKFTLGIYTFGSLSLFLLANFYQSLRKKSKTELINNLFAIINSCLAFTSISFIFLVPAQFLLYLKSIIIYLLIAAAVGALVWLIQKRVKEQSYITKKTTVKSLNLPKSNFLIPWFIFYIIYSSLLVYTLSSDSTPGLIDYLKNSWEISSGYSSAMSIVGSKTQLALAISNFLLIIWLMFFIAKDGYVNLSLSLLFVLFIAFKHGFVRQDNHVVIFAIIMPLIVSLVIPKIKQFRFQKRSYYLYFYILLTSILISQIKLPVSNRFQEIYKIKPNYVISNLVYLTNINDLQRTIQKETAKNLSSVQLFDNVKNLVSDKPIDIIPWEISLVPANQLNWKPRPIFQSYSAYTTALDNINFNSLSEETRDYLFYQFQSIDKRHPFFDEPKTFSYIFCNYEPSAEIPDFIKTPQISNIILLEKRKASRCSPTSLNEISSISWGNSHSIETSNDAIIRANVKFQYSLVGKIYKTLFRAPPVMMKVNYIDGSQKTYRIIPENSENGVIVSHLPKNNHEAMLFFRGQLSARVKSFNFQTTNSFLYAPNIEMSFSSDILHY